MTEEYQDPLSIDYNIEIPSTLFDSITAQSFYDLAAQTPSPIYQEIAGRWARCAKTSALAQLDGALSVMLAHALQECAPQLAALFKDKRDSKKHAAVANELRALARDGSLFGQRAAHDKVLDNVHGQINAGASASDDGVGEDNAAQRAHQRRVVQEDAVNAQLQSLGGTDQWLRALRAIQQFVWP